MKEYSSLDVGYAIASIIQLHKISIFPNELLTGTRGLEIVHCFAAVLSSMNLRKLHLWVLKQLAKIFAQVFSSESGLIAS